MYQRICFGAANHLYNYSGFVCDTEADIADLPTSKKKMPDGSNCCAGSQALVLGTQKKYMLNNQDEWIEIGNIGSGLVSNVDIATVEETKAFLGIQQDEFIAINKIDISY